MEIERDGVVFGAILYEYFSKPFPLYFLGHIEVNERERGAGLGNKLMDAFEQKLLETGKAGLLSENIRSDDPEHTGWYSRRGWQQIPGTNAYVFNLPAGVTPQALNSPDLRKRIFNDPRYERVFRRIRETEK